ncbi:MAG: type III pantothenate kinase [Planctomycetaceae bacterium]
MTQSPKDDAPPADSPRLVLACDAGNTRVKVGLFVVSETSAPELPPCLHDAVFAANGELPWREVERWTDGRPGPTLCCLTGSNPDAVGRIQREWDERWPERELLPFRDVARELPVRVDEPQRVGVDRLLNAVAANAIREPGGPAVIVDSGTATTVDCVDREGAFCGGAILPGFELAARSLHEYTATLPLMTVDELRETTRHPVGRNTSAAIRSGLFWGQVGAVRELVTRLRTFLGSDSPAVLLTGGGAALLAAEFPEAKWESHLSLQGLALTAVRRAGRST